MARYGFTGRARDAYGNSIGYTDVTIYLTGTTSAATVFSSYASTVPISSVPQIITDATGYFHFFVDTDYHSNDLFDIVCGGVTYDKIDIVRRSIVTGKQIGRAHV